MNIHISAWLKASRLASQSYILFPLLFGQALYFYQSGILDWNIFILVQLFGLFDQLYIVYANDYADIPVDRLNSTYNMFSGGSRVLIDGDLEPSQIKHAAWLMAGASVVIGIIFTLKYGLWWSIPLIVIALGLLWMYSYPPFKQSYRGGGEVLQMFGVGLILPLVGYYAQKGTFTDFPWLLMLSILPAQLACAMATSLPDEPSDREGGKRTASVILSPKKAKLNIIRLNIFSILIFPFVSWYGVTDIRNLWILITPILATIALFPFKNSEPGSTKLTLFVFFSILTTVGLMAGMAFALFVSG